jgi:hypothetical protein
MVVKSLQFRKWRIYQGLGGVIVDKSRTFSGDFAECDRQKFTVSKMAYLSEFGGCDIERY